ncbi:hypothetical protein N0V86_006145 [Didymella sp. IMI 355093]|nr:hypothetical protein N0V86_006145 [Didymella sp. IMI 355093]
MAPSITIASAPPRISARDAKLATVIVGSDEVSFTVHEQLLTFYSPFFRAALKGGFAEATRGEVRLKDVNEETFELFVHWLYHQRFPNKTDDPEFLKLWYHLDSTTVDAGALVDLHVFAEEYDVPNLKRQSIDSLFEQLNDEDQGLPSTKAIRYAFDSLDHDSSLCRLLVDAHCEWGGHEGWETICEGEDFEPHPVFLKNALKRYSQYIIAGLHGLGKTLVLCDYHDHKDVEERNTCVSKVAH